MGNELPILEFTGAYHFLSNFYPASVIGYPTVEHAYQAMKSLDMNYRTRVRMAGTPGAAKRLGQKCELRSDWDQIKNDLMLELVRMKFTTHPALLGMLMATGNAHLEEGNWWNDKYWGTCNGVGMNHLGKILMAIRQEIRNGPN